MWVMSCGWRVYCCIVIVVMANTTSTTTTSTTTPPHPPQDNFHVAIITPVLHYCMGGIKVTCDV